MARRNQFDGAAVPMEAGERDRYVVIQQRPDSDATGISGYPVDNWTTLASVWMRRMDASGSERFRAAQLSSAVDTQWEMGYRPDMDPTLVNVPKLRRLLYQSRAYDIVFASEIGRREGIELITLAGSQVSE